MVPGIRWIVPDLIGFGRSDKPKNRAIHTWEWHRDVLEEWLRGLKTKPVHLVHATGAEPLARLLSTQSPELFVNEPPIHANDEMAGDSVEAWQAPFPDRGHEAVLRVFGPVNPDSSGPSAEQAAEIAGIVKKRC